jgi:hypothetical protein
MRWSIQERSIVRRALRLIRQKHPQTETILEALADEWQIVLDPSEELEEAEARVVSRYGRTGRSKIRGVAKAGRAERRKLSAKQQAVSDGVSEVSAVDAAGPDRRSR